MSNIFCASVVAIKEERNLVCIVNNIEEDHIYSIVNQLDVE